MEGQQNQSVEHQDLAQQSIDEELIIKIKFADLQKNQNLESDQQNSNQMSNLEDQMQEEQKDIDSFNEENSQNIQNLQQKAQQYNKMTQNYKNIDDDDNNQELNVNDEIDEHLPSMQQDSSYKNQNQMEEEDDDDDEEEEEINYENIQFEEDENNNDSEDGEEDGQSSIPKQQQKKQKNRLQRSQYDTVEKEQVVKGDDDEDKALRDVNQSEEQIIQDKMSRSSQLDDDLFDGEDEEDLSSLGDDELQSSNSEIQQNVEEEKNNLMNINTTTQNENEENSENKMIQGGINNIQSEIQQNKLNNQENQQHIGLIVGQIQDNKGEIQLQIQENKDNLNEIANTNLDIVGINQNSLNQQQSKQPTNNKFFNRRGGRPSKKMKLNDGQQEIIQDNQQNDKNKENKDEESKKEQDEKKLTKHQFYKYKKLQSKLQNVKENYSETTMTQDEMIKLSFESAARFNDKLLSNKLKLTQIFKKNEQEQQNFRTNIDNDKSFQSNQIPLLIYDYLNNKMTYNMNNSMQIKYGTINEFISLNVNHENSDYMNDHDSKMPTMYSSRNARKRRKRRTNAQILADMQKSDD